MCSLLMGFCKISLKFLQQPVNITFMMLFTFHTLGMKCHNVSLLTKIRGQLATYWKSYIIKPSMQIDWMVEQLVEWRLTMMSTDY